MAKKYPKDFVKFLKSIKAKRPKTVIDHILKRGHITTEELKNKYGYNHPPRAVRDVREHGVPIETFRVVGGDGRKIAAYKFGDPKKSRFKKISGRTGLSKKIREFLIKKYGCRCFIYLEELPEKHLQIDHRIPFEVAGESDSLKPDDFMLLSGSANRAKSWTCEHCENWQSKKNKTVCLTCYWAYPEKYTHVAMVSIRRVDLVWKGKDVKKYEALKKHSKMLHKEIPALIKEIIEKELDSR